MEGERRIVTMLFCDVVGSTALAERLDPEEWTEIMNEVFEHLMRPIDRYGGTLARLMGDAIFALFGAPTAHEDDPERAVASGCAIVDAIGAYRGTIAADLDLNVRVGINTGPVVVGEVGSDVRVEYTAMGDAVNVAARMEQTAEPGTVQITADTARLVRAAFDLGPPRAIAVKGKAEPIVAHLVAGRKRPSASATGSGERTPLVGRDGEMATLRRVVDEALEGRGGMVALIGEPGLGKSRLIEETRAYWSARRPRTAYADSDIRRIWEVWQCVSFDTARPYAQYRRMLSAIAGIADTDPPEVVRDKLAATVEPEAPEWLEPHMRVWRSLLGVPEPGEDPLEGEAFRSAIMDLVPRSTRHFGADPRLLVFEDLHWCDEASMDLLIETARVVDDLPTLLLFAFRPDREAPSWRLKRWLETEHEAHRSTEIWLSPLSEDDSARLIDGLLPERSRSEVIRAGILERTEGNPLFLEELAAAVGAEGSNDTVPDTLQAVITARLDTLDEDARRTLQLASVIGRTFPEQVLGAVTGDGAELRGRLDALERAGLIRAIARDPEPEYAFHHSLTQEAAYGTILRRDRRALHRSVGTALEQLYANRLEDFAPVLVHHLSKAGDDEATLRYARMAGDHAARLYANADAVTHYEVAIGAGRRLGAAETLGHLYPSRGRALELAGRFDEAESNYRDMRSYAEDVGDRAAELQATMSLTTLYTTPTPKFDVADGRRASQQAVELARELGDRGAESKALWNLVNLNVFGGGDIREAVEAGERSLSLARELGELEQTAFTLNDLWRPYVAMGDLSAARRSLDEARPIWRELENLPMLTENLASAASLSRFAGDEDDALALAREAREVAASIGNLWGQAYAAMNAYEIHLDRGDVGTAVTMMREGIDMGERSGFLAAQATFRATLAETYGYLGDPNLAQDTAAIALDIANERLPTARPWVLGATAQILLWVGDLDRAEAALADSHVEVLPEPLRSAASVKVPLVRGSIADARGDHAQAIEIADAVLARLRRAGLRPFVTEAMLLKGQALAAGGETRDAIGTLQEARRTADGLGHRRILWEILLALAPMVAEQERLEMLAEARRIVRSIADGVEEDLRRTFLARPDVHGLMEGAASPWTRLP